jgi:L-amino acid N-acyltransferase YncA
MLAIREATEADWPAIWAMFRKVAAAGDSFAYDADTPEAVARKLWVEPPARAFVAEIDGRVAGTCYVRPNQPGRGDHVANAGYMVADEARGRGVASALCTCSVEEARRLGFRAMQFNFVVSTNAAALRVWEKHGFAVVGRVPRAFRHAVLGPVDVLILHREL